MDETKHPTKPVKPFGPDASQFAKDTLEGKEIGIEYMSQNETSTEDFPHTFGLGTACLTKCFS